LPKNLEVNHAGYLNTYNFLIILKLVNYYNYNYEIDRKCPSEVHGIAIHGAVEAPRNHTNTVCS